METRALGWTGVQVPVIGQGTWQMEIDPRAQCIGAIRRGLDAGMTHVDTAEMYGSGQVEEIVAEAIKGRRDEVYLVSKVLPHHASYQGTLDACDKSLLRLRTDRLDLYLLHWAGSHPLEETLRAFEELQREGKIRAYGVSNFDVSELERAVKIAGERRIACNQVLYHLQERAIEHEIIPWCEKHEVAVVAYSPFGSGDFPGPRSAGGKVLAEIAERHGATPRQVALRFLVRRRSVVTIPKAAAVGHVLDNAAAGDLELTAAELARIDEAFPLGTRRPGVPTL
jgi:diketogulonate reductase-like aldo/keto reductase